MSKTLLACGNTPQSNFEAQYQRIFEATECRTQVESAEFLGIRQSSISDAKRRKTIPAEWLLKNFDKKGDSPGLDTDRDGGQSGDCFARRQGKFFFFTRDRAQTGERVFYGCTSG